MTEPKVILHIGKHKTGTTSFQAYMSDQKKELQKHGVLFVPVKISNFIAASIIRDQLPIPPVKSLNKVGVAPSVEKAHTNLENFLYGKNFRILLLSCEHFSYFRQQTEIDALVDLLQNAAQIKRAVISVCLVLRQPEDFLNSYTKQIIKSGHGVSREKASPYYCKSDSWLLDDNSIIALWKANFDHLDIIHYEDGNTVLQLCSTIDLPVSDSVETYYLKKKKNRISVWMKGNFLKPLLESAISIKKKVTSRS